MRKLLFGLLLCGLLCLPIAVHAWTGHQMAQPIYGFDCAMGDMVDSRGYPVYDSAGNKQPDPKNPDGRCSGTVYVFDNGPDKCYVAKVSNGAGITCLRGQ